MRDPTRSPLIWVLIADGDTARLYCGDEAMNKLTPALPRELTALEVSLAPPARAATAFAEADIWNESAEMWDVPAPAGLRDARALFADHLRDCSATGRIPAPMTGSLSPPRRRS